MFFLIDHQLKIIFGWSAKSGCSHIKKIYWFLKEDDIDHKIHINIEYSKLPDNIELYDIIIICRNPYKRLVSGFLDKYNKIYGECKNTWTYDILTFSMFVDELIKNDWNVVNKHHFTLQTSEEFNEDIIVKCKKLKIFDIENIDYKYIEELYNKKIPEQLLNFRGGHERRIKEIKFKDDKVYDLDMEIYFNYNVEFYKFYNKQIKNKVYYFYKNDFDFFNKFGFNYENTDLHINDEN